MKLQHSKRVARWKLTLLGVAYAGSSHIQAALPLMGPGIPKVTFQNSELFKPLSYMHTRYGQNIVAMNNGYLMAIFGPDAPGMDGGLTFWDITNPRAIKVVKTKDDADTRIIREAHGMGFSSSYDGDYAVIQTGLGIQFWDLTDVNNPTVLKSMTLPDVKPGDYSEAVWHLYWQAPYVYVSGSTLGLYIVDAKDPRNPVLLNRIYTSKLGGFSIGQVYPIGNLLVMTSMGLGTEKGFTMMDISDPKNPVMLTTTLQTPTNYSTHVNGNRLYTDGVDGAVHIYDISDPTRFKTVGQINLAGNGEYLMTQDNFLHVGRESFYCKIDLATNKIIGQTSIAGQEGFATPLGNMVLIGDDHGEGSALVAHQMDPDTKGPKVTMINPPSGAIRQALTSRIGITMSDMIQTRSIDITSFIVRPLGGQPLPGKYGNAIGIVNFFPDEPLEANTTYEVVITQGGIRDFSGNPTEEEFTSRFSTGETVDQTTGIPERRAKSSSRSNSQDHLWMNMGFASPHWIMNRNTEDPILFIGADGRLYPH